MASELMHLRPSSMDMDMARPSCTVATRIHDFIHMSEGASNAYLLTTDEGNVLINTGLAIEAPIHKDRFEQVSQAPLRYILITQGHVDHIGGVGLFREPATEVIAQRNIEGCMADDERIMGFRLRRNLRFFPEILERMLSAEGQAMLAAGATQAPKVEPTLRIDRYHSFRCGERYFELFSAPGGETVDTLLVWLPEERILFTGNALGPLFPHMPNFYTIRGDRLRFALPYLEVCERILELRPRMMITGHFDPVEGEELIHSEVSRLRDAVRYIHDATVKGMNEGRDAFALMKEIRLPEELQVGEAYGTVPWAVRAIWEGYGGWFQFLSTTELYAVPPAQVYPEVAALAGADSLADRAGQLLAADRPLEAIHLCEMTLAAEAGHTRALEVYRQAHARLLEQSDPGNRWQQYWLRPEAERVADRARDDASKDE